ncbi:MAG: type IV toxin-antitoxin system AbiEi family antitoxin domain-containing protein [Candidatus Omnitrophota bacterium]|nr:MAG: type IV toxin-antitoxin system AbiEi family antitoxin domain-containing protein [Candidatus Omnitrophota bacterium]
MGFKKNELVDFLKKRGGVASYAEIIGAGFSKTHLKAGLNSGWMQKVDRGLYRLSDGTPLSNPDLVAVSIKVPKGTVCLLSALAFHEATNEIPQYVDIAIQRGAYANKIKYPPVKFYRFAPKVWKVGIEKYDIEGHEIKVYSLAKTVADCFKFRNKIGMNVARDALKVAVTEKNITPKEIMQHAKICRVDKIIKPILETML